MPFPRSAARRAGALLSCAALALASSSSSAAAVVPVPALNPLAYVGRWFQMYSDLASSLIESRFCVTADYGLYPNITVSVRNEERVGSPTGAYKQILGFATFTPGAPGELSVNLQGVPVPAPYWVLELGPVNAAGFYDVSARRAARLALASARRARTLLERTRAIYTR